MKKSPVKKIILTILVLGIIYALLGFLDYKGMFVQGTYKTEGSSEEFVLKFWGKIPSEMESEDYKESYKVYGNEIHFYINDEEAMSGVYQNGVIKITSVIGIPTEKYYCLTDKTKDDFKEKSIIDYVKLVVNPVSKLFKNL